jgi:hypothetical protein
MDLVRRLGGRGVHETVNFATVLMRPVFEVLNIVLSLRGEISQVRFRHIFRRRPAEIVDIHV